MSEISTIQLLFLWSNMMDSCPKLKAEKGCSAALGHDSAKKKKGCSAGAVQPTQQQHQLPDPDLTPDPQIQAWKPPARDEA